MEVIFPVALAILVIAYSFYKLYSSKSRLQAEASEIAALLSKTIEDHERDLNDHLAAEHELAIVNAKLETLRSSTITPENSIPKHAHVEKVLELSQSLVQVKVDLDEMTQKFEESRGKQISVRVKMGQIGEQFVFFNEGFKYDRKETKSLLQPIDLICFEEDEVVFVEVKTGEAKLSQKQKRIKTNIQEGRVRFEVLRIDEQGFHWSDN